MSNNFKSLSLSYKKASIELREALSLDEKSIKSYLKTVSDLFPITDLMLLSTCNRTEIYYCSEKTLTSELIKLLCLQKGISNYEKYLASFEVFNEEKEAIKHLFAVSMGLHSQVVGDIQISNQVKNAYQWSADEQVAGPFLHHIMHSIFYTNKRVVQETPYRDGTASTSFAAVEITEELTQNIKNPRILIVGLGEIGIDVCKNFENTKLDNIVLINRTFEKAEKLASELGYRAVKFDELEVRVKEADVIISSIRTETPMFTKAFFNDFEVVSGKLFIDLSIPRSVSKDIEEIPSVLLYNIDDLEVKTNEIVSKRKEAVPQVQQIINESIAEFDEWSKEMEVSPTIHKLKNALEEIRKGEIAKYTKSVDEKELKLIEDITKGLMQKIIKLPVLQLKAACKRGEAETLIDVLNGIFDLEKQSDKIIR